MSLKNLGISENLYKRLTGIVKSGNIMHAYIFESSFGLDKEELATEFAKAILCENPQDGDACDGCRACRRAENENNENIIFAEVSDKGSVKDEAIEKLQENLKRKPLEGDRKVAVIPGGDTLTARAQNRLLKTLEEPQGNAVIIILADNVENLLKTIRSRCVIFRISDYSAARGAEMADLAQEIAEMMISGAPTYRIFKMTEDILPDRGKVVELMDALELVYRDLLVSRSPKSRLYKRQYIYSAVDILEEAKHSILSSSGVNAGYALKNALLRIGG